MHQVSANMGKKFHKKNHQLKRQAAYLREQLSLIGPAHLGLTEYDPYFECSAYDDDPESDFRYGWEDDWEAELEMGEAERRFDDIDYAIYDDYLEYLFDQDDLVLGEMSH